MTDHGMTDAEHDAANEQAALMVRQALRRQQERAAALALACQAAMSWASHIENESHAVRGGGCTDRYVDGLREKAAAIRAAVKTVEAGA